MKNPFFLVIALFLFCGCMSHPNSFEMQTVKAGELAERAVAEKFTDIPTDALLWSEVSWYSTRTSKTGEFKISVITRVLDYRTLKRDSYYAPKVKRFRVEHNKELDVISVELDSDGYLKDEEESKDDLIEFKYPEYEVED